MVLREFIRTIYHEVEIHESGAFLDQCWSNGYFCSCSCWCGEPITAFSVPGEVGVFVDRDEDQARRPVRVPELVRRFVAQMPACDQRSPLRGVLHAAVAGTNRAPPPRKEALMELMKFIMAWIMTSADAMDTPFKWTKQVASHFGGTRNGMIIS